MYALREQKVTAKMWMDRICKCQGMDCGFSNDEETTVYLYSVTTKEENKSGKMIFEM